MIRKHVEWIVNDVLGSFRKESARWSTGCGINACVCKELKKVEKRVVKEIKTSEPRHKIIASRYRHFSGPLLIPGLSAACHLQCMHSVAV